MPIYEYQCTSCEHKLQALQKISEEPLTQCPSCHQPQLKKLISAARFRLKGSGWYETDFKTGDKKQLAESESADTKQAKSNSDEAKPDSANKPDSKASKKNGEGTKSETTAAKPSAATDKSK